MRWTIPGIALWLSATAVDALPQRLLQIDRAGAALGSTALAVGDVDGDGDDDVLAGAPLYSNGQNLEGALVLFRGGPGGVTDAGRTVIESNRDGGLDGTRLGTSVASGGDLNGDGRDDVVLGARYYSNGQSQEGAVYVFLGRASGLASTPDAILESDQALAFMGWSVAIPGDLNGDGYDDVVASVPNYSHPQQNEGAALVYFGGPGMGFDGAIDAVLEHDQPFQQINAVAAAGDLDLDGFADVLVASSRLGNGEAGEGLVWVYRGGPGAFDTTPDLRFESQQANAAFGTPASMAAVGDLNGDGFPDLALGAVFYSHGEASEGAVHVFLGGPWPMDTQADAILESNQASAVMRMVGAAGDVDGDGYADLLAGAPPYDLDQADEGAAFLYRGGPGGSFQPDADRIYAAGQASAGYGVALARGDTDGDGHEELLVAASGYDAGELDEGVVFASPLEAGVLFRDGLE